MLASHKFGLMTPGGYWWKPVKRMWYVGITKPGEEKKKDPHSKHRDNETIASPGAGFGVWRFIKYYPFVNASGLWVWNAAHKRPEPSQEWKTRANFPSIAIRKEFCLWFGTLWNTALRGKRVYWYFLLISSRYSTGLGRVWNRWCCTCARGWLWLYACKSAPYECVGLI